MSVGAVSTLLCAVGVVLNGAIVLTIWIKGLMRIPSTRFVFSLTLSHFLASLISLGASPLLGYADRVGEEVILYVTCFTLIATLITLTLISVERYVTIARPMEYKRIVTPSRCFISICLTWLISLLLVIPSLVFSPHGEGHGLLKNRAFSWYWGTVLLVLTITALVIMVHCYSHIFKIAKGKCGKVRLGEFRSAPASISSDWPSSVHPSSQHNSSSQIVPLPRGTSSISLLQWVLLRHKVFGRGRSRHDEETGRMVVRSAPTSPIMSGSSDSRARRRWRTYLRQNYNSPRKTIITILSLIGSVILTSIPPIFALLTFPSLFAPIHGILFPLSSTLHPILYGIFNRNIRSHLLKLRTSSSLSKSLRRKKVRTPNHNKRKVSGVVELLPIPINLQFNRKGSLATTSEEEEIIRDRGDSFNHTDTSTTPITPRKDTGLRDEFADRVRLLRARLQLNHLGVPGIRPEVHEQRLNPSPESRFLVVETAAQVEEDQHFPPGLPQEEEEMVPEVEEVGNNDDELSENEELDPQLMELLRKASQDSGADMYFSDEEDEQDCPPSPFLLRGSHNPSLRHLHELYMQAISKSDSDISCPRRHSRKCSSAVNLNTLRVPYSGGGSHHLVTSVSADAHLNHPSLCGVEMERMSRSTELLLMHRDSKGCQHLLLPLPQFSRMEES